MMTNPIIAKYIFTIGLNKKGNRTISVTMPPIQTTEDMSNIFSWCTDHYEKIQKKGFIINKHKDDETK